MSFNSAKFQGVMLSCLVSGLILSPVLALPGRVAALVPANLLAQSQTAMDYYEEGVKLYESGDIAGAAAAFRQAVALDGNLAEAHANLGSILANEDRFAEAIPLFETAIRLKPNLAVFHYQLGAALFLNNQTDAAIKGLETARNLLQKGKLRRLIQLIEP